MCARARLAHFLNGDERLLEEVEVQLLKLGARKRLGVVLAVDERLHLDPGLAHGRKDEEEENEEEEEEEEEEGGRSPASTHNTSNSKQSCVKKKRTPRPPLLPGAATRGRA